MAEVSSSKVVARVEQLNFKSTGQSTRLRVVCPETVQTRRKLWEYSTRSVLITGTGGGLGRVAAQTFAREGAKVVGCDIKVDTNNETVQLVRRAGGELNR